MSYELATISTDDLNSVTGGNGRFDYLMQQKAKPQAPHTPAKGGSSGPNFLQRWGQATSSIGEYAAAAGGVGTVAAPEAVLPEALAAGGAGAWLVGKGLSAVGGLFHH
jgi:hypothetical protein